MWSKSSRANGSQRTQNVLASVSSCSDQSNSGCSNDEGVGDDEMKRRDVELWTRDNNKSSKRKCIENEFEFEPSCGLKRDGRGRKCESRNAFMARQNRIKKKLHLQSVEKNLTKLTEENKKLKTSLESQSANVTVLKDRVRYLESVLANSRELGMLLRAVSSSTGLPTTNSLLSNPGNTCAKLEPKSTSGFPPPQPDHIYSKTPSEHSNTFLSDPFLSDESTGPLLADDIFLPSEAEMNFDLSDFNRPFDFESFEEDVGICLHIAKKRVSLEFCSGCNDSSTTAWDNNNA